MVSEANDIKNAVDIASTALALGSVVQILPTIAAVASIAWTLIRIGEWAYAKWKKRKFNPLDY